ncbi:putative disease resistance protein isoform X3 [Iris pallida]|uniref:Disease resistance protein isoform X3 n=1 Tax=Iris pallida TaxID=29817 RepID=A0AAX6I505_IRIPA|nr:putative disease resistance protein isoform X3 [Iris pallida]
MFLCVCVKREREKMASAVVKFALEKVGNILIQEGLLLYGVRDNIEWLRTELRWMECFLIDAERKEKKGDERVKNWVMEVRDVVFQAEDVMDTIIEQIEKRRKLLLGRRSPRIIRLLKRYALYPFELKALHDIGTEIALIRTKVRVIKESRETYGIVDLGHETRAESSRDQPPHLRQLHPHLDDDTVVVGFGDHKKVIVDHLLDTNMERRCVISVVGMGGLGKTTLALKVYNEVKSNFDTCAWITVSQEYNDTELLKCINGKINPAQNVDLVDDLVLNLYNLLKGKKYLIVMDDIWDTDVWALVKPAFPSECNGSRVMFTTRLMDIAKSADSRIQPVELPYLSYEHSRGLLLRKAFLTHPDADPSCPDELEEAADELVRKCGGLPLALVVLGGLLSVKEPTFNVWKDTADSLNWDSSRDGKGCLEVLALSYDDLPDHRYKSCFLYLGSWPEDSVIKASELVWLWIGEGFVPTEETATGYLDELAQRCMIQVVERSRTNGRIRKFRIHDLFRDLCISVAKKNRFFTTYNYSNEDDDVVTSRRLVVCDPYGYVRVQNAGTMMSYSIFRARSLLFFHLVLGGEGESFVAYCCSNLLGMANSAKRLLQHFFHSFRQLRVIHLNVSKGAGLVKRESYGINMPEEIGGLIHLRYLHVICYSCSLPSSIENLSNLQTLHLTGVVNFRLPKSLWKIQTLARFRCLPSNEFMPSSGIGCQKSLRILQNVRAGRWMRQLKELTSLRKLAITNISEKEQVDMLCESLCKLDHLTSLYLEIFVSLLATTTLFSSLPSHHNFRKLTISSFGLAPHTGLSGLSQNLANLSLERMKLARETVTALEGLQGLVVLQIRYCRILEDRLYFRGGFRRLRHLRLAHLERLRYMRIESGAMKDLAQLTIDTCINLAMVPEGLEHLASVKKLVVSGMPDGFVERIREGGEDIHKIQHIPSVDIKLKETLVFSI